MTTQAPPKPVTFVSRGDNQRITIEGEKKPQFDVRGRVVVMPDQGKHIQFEKNEFVASEESAEKIGIPLDELLDFLRSHENFNMNRTGGFWEEGAAPDEPKPTLTDQMRAVALASAAGDIPLLEAIRGVENETHKRVAVLQSIEAAIEAIDTAAPSEDEDAGEPSADGSDSPEPSGENPPAE